VKEVSFYIEILALMVILPIFSIRAQTASVGHSARHRRMTAEYAIDTIMRLPEIMEDNAYIRRATKGKKHLFGMIYGDPDSLHPYYWVVIGEDNGMAFVTHFTFYVYTNGRKILYHDNFGDSTIDLSVWRRNYRRK
jgi:hypothetical protein